MCVCVYQFVHEFGHGEVCWDVFRLGRQGLPVVRLRLHVVPQVHVGLPWGKNGH